MSEQNNQQYNSIEVFSFLFKYWKFLTIITLLTIGLAIFFSSPIFISPKYKAEVIIFPASSNGISRILLMDNPKSAQEDILAYGSEVASEQLLQILNSSRIMNKVVTRFNLAEHYHIDKKAINSESLLNKKFQRNVNFSRTKFSAVKISVMDESPQMAADIANSISELVDSVKNEISNDRAIKAYNIVLDRYNQQLSYTRAIEDSLNSIRKLGLYDYNAQSEILMSQLSVAISKNNQTEIKNIEKKLEHINQYASTYMGLTKQLEIERENQSLLKRKYEEVKVDAFEILPQHFVIEKAYPPQEKDYPIRWIIILFSAISVLFFSIFVLLIAHRLDFLNTKK